jgi:transcription-repair coupling factor (superfamily II helicase)
LNIKQYLKLYQEHPYIVKIAEWIKQGSPFHLHLRGLVGSADSVVAAALFNEAGSTHLFILPDVEEAAYFRNDLENMLEGRQILLLPASYKRAFQLGTSDNASILQRAEVLNQLKKATETGRLLVTYPEALCEKVITRQLLQQNTFDIKVGDTFDLDFLLELLIEQNFDRSDFVYEAGQFSIRGGIIDVFSFASDLPYRIELNGEQVESIRMFDPDSQLSQKNVQFFTLIPNVQVGFEGQEKISLLDYIGPKANIWVKDVTYMKEVIDKGFDKIAETDYSELENIPEDPRMLFESSGELVAKLKAGNTIEFGKRFRFKENESFVFEIAPQPPFHKNFKLLIENLRQNQEAGFENLIFSETSRQVERLYTIFEDLDRSIKFTPIYHGLSQGFIDRQLRIAAYTEHQIFDRYYRHKTHSSFTKSKALTLKELKELKAGDFVTHIDHGIGKFAGLEKIEVNGRVQEAVRLVYRDNDLLYVNINSLHKIAKFSGKEGTVPKLNKLGSDAWEKLKRTTKKKVKDIARDLIELYAKRKAKPGFAFSPDSYLQVELEASFMYEDTPDQSKATEDVKKDMESPHPMDRLVCGDVGFGKTEVAIRAAFKAVSDSKQVAILVPTTILAQQHYHTFKERLGDFPATVDYINRFKSPSAQKETLKKLAEGKVDILIGTHRIVSRDVKFKNLGLLIVDEEQKFGVSTKEKLKEMRVNIDTLTLTATPIPRTLHFSLMGARDLSIINTPPPNRQPVNTELHVFDAALIKEAVEFEVERGGQVFFVHHRVKDIYDMADMIRKNSPGISVGVGHGQMEGEQLEDVMIKFVEGEYDVLVATTIIESGLDIPNANTIIINNAHMFGLSDLHQMRGRVGRSNRKSFCYLLSPPLSVLTPEARKRLSAIEEFSELGSGFSVAMRDLDIRGAGNLLGGEQSGFIAEIGFEMYHKILDEAIQELKEDEFKELFKDEKPKPVVSDCQVDTDFHALIPDEYVRSTSERLSLYNELAGINTEEALMKYMEKLIDRFGPLPAETRDLLNVMRLKHKANALALDKLLLKNGTMTAYISARKPQSYFESDTFGRILSFVQTNHRTTKMKQTDVTLTITFSHVSRLEDGLRLLGEMVGVEVTAKQLQS